MEFNHVSAGYELNVGWNGIPREDSWMLVDTRKTISGLGATRFLDITERAVHDENRPEQRADGQASRQGNRSQRAQLGGPKP